MSKSKKLGGKISPEEKAAKQKEAKRRLAEIDRVLAAQERVYLIQRGTENFYIIAERK